MTWATLIVSVLGAINVAGLLSWLSARRKAPIEADNLIVEGARQVVDIQSAALLALRQDVTALNRLLEAERDTRQRETAALWERLAVAVDHVVSVHDWIEGGMRPPPPTRPVWAVRPDPTSWATPTSLITRPITGGPRDNP